MTTAEKIAFAGVAIASVGVIAPLWLGVVNERKRTQPITVAHEDRGRHFASGGVRSGWAVLAHLRNEGAGPAFNVRWGVEFHGVRIPYKLVPDDPPSGNRQRVLQQGERVPPEASFELRLPDLLVWSGKGDPDPGRVYWCRYENASGHTWETRNPGDRSADLDIRRVRMIRWWEWREARRFKQALAVGAATEARALGELREGLPQDDRD